MAQYSAEVIDKYKTALLKNPSSQVFAPLADAYREMGHLDIAEKTCRQGIKNNPQLASGWVVLGKILKDQKKLDEAIQTLTHALSISADNILAHQLLGEIYLEKRNTDLAIKSYKMVLFFNPHHQKVKKILEKIESLSAKNYSEDLFQFKKLNAIEDNSIPVSEESIIIGASKDILEPKTPDRKNISIGARSLIRVLSLVDAFIVRNELAKASELLKEALAQYPEERELLQRSKLLRTRQQVSFIDPLKLNLNPETTNAEVIKEIKLENSQIIKSKKLKILNSILQTIESRKNNIFQ